MEQRIQLSDHFGFGRLIRFTIPSILMMIFTSIYGVVDGYFVSNFVGKTPFAAVNFIMPFLMVVGAMGFMFGTGGSALIARIMGEGRREKAQEIFSLLIAATFVSGLVIAVISILFLPQIAAFLGAKGEMLADCIRYGRIILVALPFLMLQYAFGSLSVTAEKPKLGLIVTIISGVLNMTGDVLFMGVFHWGIAGAAMATAMGQIIGGTIPLVYFLRKNSSSLRLRRPKWDGGALRRACTNGVSELMSSISMSIVGMLYNAQLMRYAGENGVAAYGTIMYVDFIFLAIFIGYATGVAPVISYPDGASELLPVEINPNDESSGTKNVSFSKTIYIEKSDFMEVPVKGYKRLTADNEVRLKGAYFIKVKEIIKDENGEVTELIRTYDPASKGGNSPDGRKVKGTIQWVDANCCLDATVNMYDKLFLTSNPGELEDYLDNLNPDSLKVLKHCKIDADLASAKPGDSFQFMRNGYFTVDKYSTEDNIIFNLTASLKDSFKVK